MESSLLGGSLGGGCCVWHSRPVKGALVDDKISRSGASWLEDLRVVLIPLA